MPFSPFFSRWRQQKWSARTVCLGQWCAERNSCLSSPASSATEAGRCSLVRRSLPAESSFRKPNCEPSTPYPGHPGTREHSRTRLARTAVNTDQQVNNTTRSKGTYTLLRSADADKQLVPRSCTASFGLRSFHSFGLTAWNDMPAHLHNLDLSLSDFRQLLKTALFQTVPV